MIGVQFNAGKTRDALRAAIAQLQDMTPVYEDIGEYMIGATKARFLTGTSPGGAKWAPKSEATLARYKRLGYGTLSKPLKGPTGRLSNEIVKFVSRDGVVIGSSLIYSRVMQDGAAKGEFGNDARGHPIPWGRIPAREWLGISADDATNIVEIVEEHLGTKLNAS